MITWTCYSASVSYNPHHWSPGTPELVQEIRPTPLVENISKSMVTPSWFISNHRTALDQNQRQEEQLVSLDHDDFKCSVPIHPCSYATFTFARPLVCPREVRIVSDDIRKYPNSGVGSSYNHQNCLQNLETMQMHVFNGNRQMGLDRAKHVVESVRAVRTVMPFKRLIWAAPQKEQYFLHRSPVYAKRLFEE